MVAVTGQTIALELWPFVGYIDFVVERPIVVIIIVVDMLVTDMVVVVGFVVDTDLMQHLPPDDTTPEEHDDPYSSLTPL